MMSIYQAKLKKMRVLKLSHIDPLNAIIGFFEGVNNECYCCSNSNGMFLGYKTEH